MTFWKTTLSAVVASLVTAVILALAPKALDYIGLFPTTWSTIVEWSDHAWGYVTYPLTLPAWAVVAIAIAIAFLGIRYENKAFMKGFFEARNLSYIPDELLRPKANGDPREIELKRKYTEAVDTFFKRPASKLRPLDVTEDEQRLLLLLGAADGVPVAFHCIPDFLGISNLAFNRLHEKMERQHIIQTNRRSNPPSVQFTSIGRDYALQWGYAH